MSAFEDFRARVTAMFKDGFTEAGEPLFPTQYENHAFTRPDGTWCRFAIREGQRENGAVGDTLKRTPGILFLQVFMAEDRGTRDGALAGDKMAAIFDNVSISEAWGSVQFFTTSKQNVGKTQEGWFQVNVSVDFRLDELSG